MEYPVDLATWPRAEVYRFYKTYTRPHFSVTSRIDVTDLMTRLKPKGVSPYRASLYAIGAGLHAVPELCMRFRDGGVIRHDAVELTMSVPTQGGSFGFAYVPYARNFETFDATARTLIDDVARGTVFDANTGPRDDLAYLSCMQWLDSTSLSNAMPGPDDCIPRVGWGKITDTAGRFSMAMTLEVHHALADGAHVGAYFDAVQTALSSIPAP